MSRIKIPSIDETPEASRPTLDKVKKLLGFVPNLHRLLALSPGALNGWAALMGSLGKTLDVKTREMRQLMIEPSQQRFGFDSIQTAFEDFDINTFDKLVLNQRNYGLAIPFGHDAAPNEDALPYTIEDYHTNGTPWFVVINPDGFVFILISEYRRNHCWTYD